MGGALAKHTGLPASDGIDHGTRLRRQRLPWACLADHHSILARHRSMPRNQGRGTWRHSGASDDNGMRPRNTTP